MMPQENMKREFYDDVRERKSLVPSARHKKNGSKTKFVSFPHDKITQGAWKKMNGETQSYNMRGPMKWEQFKSLPNDLAEDYLNFLVKEFRATAFNIANAFGVTYCTLGRVMDDKNITGIFHRGAKQPKKEIARMNEFFNPEVREVVVDQKKDEIQEKSEEATQLTLMETTETPPLFRCNMSKFTMKFDGEYDEKSLMNAMRLMVGQGTKCKIEITVEKEEREND